MKTFRVFGIFLRVGLILAVFQANCTKNPTASTVSSSDNNIAPDLVSVPGTQDENSTYFAGAEDENDIGGNSDAPGFEGQMGTHDFIGNEDSFTVMEIGNSPHVLASGNELEVGEGSNETKIGEGTYGPDFVTMVNEPDLVKIENGQEVVDPENRLEVIDADKGLEVVDADKGLEVVDADKGLQVVDADQGLKVVDADKGLEVVDADKGLEVVDADKGLQVVDADQGLEVVDADQGLEVVDADKGLEVVDADDGLEIVDADKGLEVVDTDKGLEVVDAGKGLEVVDADQGLEVVDADKRLEVVDTDKGLEVVDADQGLEVVDADQGLEVVDADKGLEIVDADKGLEVVDAGKGLEVVDTDKGLEVVDTDKGLEVVDTGKGLEVVDTDKGLEVVDTDKGLEVVDTGKGLDVVDADKGLEVVDTDKGLEVVDTDKGLEVVDTDKGLEVVDAGKGLEVVDSAEVVKVETGSEIVDVETDSLETENLPDLVASKNKRAVTEIVDEPEFSESYNGLEVAENGNPPDNENASVKVDADSSTDFEDNETTTDNASVTVTSPDHVCQVEEKVNVTELVPTALPGGLSICLSAPLLCPRKIFDKYVKGLVSVINQTIEKTIIVEKCCPGYVRSADYKTCVEIEEMRPTEESNGDWHEAHRRRSGLTMAKLIKSFAEKYGYSDVNQNNFEFIAVEKSKAKKNTFKQEKVVQADDDDFSPEEEEREFKKTANMIFAKCALFAGGLICAGMILFNLFLIIMTCKACRQRYRNEEIIEELEDVAKKSTKCVEWVEKPAGKPDSAIVNTTGNEKRGDKHPGSEKLETVPVKKIMPWKDIRAVILETLAGCNLVGSTNTEKSDFDAELGAVKVHDSGCIKIDIEDLPPFVPVRHFLTYDSHDLVEFNPSILAANVFDPSILAANVFDPSILAANVFDDVSLNSSGNDTDETALEDDEEDEDEAYNVHLEEENYSVPEVPPRLYQGKARPVVKFDIGVGTVE